MSEKHIDSYRQDNCADGCHIYTRSEWDGALRCRCGKVLNDKARGWTESGKPDKGTSAA